MHSLKFLTHTTPYDTPFQSQKYEPTQPILNEYTIINLIMQTQSKNQIQTISYGTMRHQFLNMNLYLISTIYK